MKFHNILSLLFTGRKRHCSLFRSDLNKSVVEGNLVVFLDDVQSIPNDLSSLVKARCGLFNKSFRSFLTLPFSQFMK